MKALAEKGAQMPNKCESNAFLKAFFTLIWLLRLTGVSILRVATA